MARTNDELVFLYFFFFFPSCLYKSLSRNTHSLLGLRSVCRGCEDAAAEKKVGCVESNVEDGR